jgi:hypothetical protein
VLWNLNEHVYRGQKRTGAAVAMWSGFDMKPHNPPDDAPWLGEVAPDLTRHPPFGRQQ